MEWEAEHTRRRTAFGYALGVILPTVGLAIRSLLGDSFQGYPFLTFFPAILVAAFVGGRWPGFLSAGFSLVLAWYFLVEPRYSFGLIWPGTYIALGFFAVISIVLVLLIDAALSANEKLSASDRERARLNMELEARVEARTHDLNAALSELQLEVASRREAEGRVNQLQRLEAVGQLTGGVAHDFNNMLGIIVGNLDLAQRRLSQGNADIVRYIDYAYDGARRGAALTQRLLAFARRQTLSPIVLDVNGLVLGMSELLRRTLGENIEVECVLSGGLWRTCADPSQLEGAILNLAVNARDAMPQGGKLAIETMNCHLDERYAAENDDVKPGQYVTIAVTDTGTGMAPEVVRQAFEPFFTTKEIGQGTGLGLSQLYGYLRQSGGHAKIYSELDQGTTVKLYLPRHLGADGPVAASEPKPEASLPIAKVGESILVVEDEKALRETAVEALRELGYDVRYQSSGAAALDVLRDSGPFSLLLTDVVMPGMTGKQLADEVLKAWPSTKVLFMTGYTRNAIVHQGKLDPGVELLPKPVGIDQLARKVRSVLDN